MSLKDLNEVTPDTSSEEIKEYAEQLIKEIAEERAGEPDRKSDAQIINDQSGIQQPDDMNETHAENNSGTTTALDDGEKSGAELVSQDWLTDDVKAEASAYGIEEAELADFASREELDRALRLFDKSIRQAATKAAEGEGQGQPRNDKGQFVKTEAATTEVVAKEGGQQEGTNDGRYKVALDPEVYDEGIITELSKMNDHYQSQIAAIVSRLDAQIENERAIAAEQQFDGLIDKLGVTNLFGTTGKESAKEIERRKAVLDEVKTRRMVLEQLGRPVEMNAALVKLAARTVFPEEFDKLLLKQQTRKISRQSDGRQGGSPTKPQPPSDTPRERAARRWQELSQS